MDWSPQNDEIGLNSLQYNKKSEPLVTLIHAGLNACSVKQRGKALKITANEIWSLLMRST